MADVMFGGGVESLLAYEDYFAPCDAAEGGDAESCRFEAHRFVAFSRLPLVIIYNPRLVSSRPPVLRICWKAACAAGLRSRTPAFRDRASPCWRR